MKRIARLLLISVFILAASQPLFAGGPWEGRIIDIETKELLEGAVVVAVWHRAWRTPAGDNPYVYKVKEVLTDKEGRFYISSYTPINILPLVSYMKGPYFIIYKPGYLSIEWHHERYFLNGSTEKVTELPGYPPFQERVFKIAPNLVELPPLKSKEERLRAIPGGPGDASSKDLPLLYKAINEENKRFGLGEVGTN